MTWRLYLIIWSFHELLRGDGINLLASFYASQNHRTLRSYLLSRPSSGRALRCSALIHPQQAPTSSQDPLLLVPRLQVLTGGRISFGATYAIE